MRRVNIFIRVTGGTGDYGSACRCYVQAVTPSNAKRIVAALERGGDSVLVYQHRDGGKLLYATEEEATK